MMHIFWILISYQRNHQIATPIETENQRGRCVPPNAVIHKRNNKNIILHKQKKVKKATREFFFFLIKLQYCTTGWTTRTPKNYDYCSINKHVSQDSNDTAKDLVVIYLHMCCSPLT